MAGAVAGSGHRGARRLVSPAGRGTVSPGADCACLDPKRSASRSNAAARIPRAGVMAGGEGFCRAGAGASGPWRHRRKISRGPARLRRGRLFPCRARHRRGNIGGAELSARTILHPTATARWFSGTRPAAGARWRSPRPIRPWSRTIVVFAAGRGGHANDFPNQVCAPHTLIASAAEFGHGARVPVTWLVAANDSYFSPDLSRKLADAFRAGGGKVDFHVLAASGSEGHWLAETERGVKIAGAGTGSRAEGARVGHGQEAMTR